jgi:hypothetical protein
VNPCVGRDLGQRGSLAPEPVRRPLHDRLTTGFGVRRHLSERSLDVVELLARQHRASEEQVIVRVGHTQLLRLQIPERGPYLHPHSRSNEVSARFMPGPDMTMARSVV